VFPRDVSAVKLTIKKENDNVVVDAKLKTAFEVMIKRITKKTFSYFAKEELVLLAKKDGENLFMKRVETLDKFSAVSSKYDISSQTAYMMCVMSQPQSNEVVLDAFAGSGVISYVRALSFAKSNVIASTADEDEKEKLKKLAKKLKPNTFSVLGYDFLDDSFPIKFIDKIVTDLTSLGYGQVETLKDFYDKAYDLKVKQLVVTMPKNYDVNRFIYEKYDVQTEVKADKYNVYLLTINKG
jgi:hypothetical protein